MTLDYQLMFGIDKQMHFLSYTAISLCCAIIMIFISERSYITRRLSFLWFALVTIGILEEYRQYLIPNRSAEFLDAIANMVGVTFGLVVPLLTWYIVRHRNHLLFKLFIAYSFILIPLMLGLIYINERPFLAIEEPVQGKVRELVAVFGL